MDRSGSGIGQGSLCGVLHTHATQVPHTHTLPFTCGVTVCVRNHCFNCILLPYLITEPNRRSHHLSHTHVTPDVPYCVQQVWNVDRVHCRHQCGVHTFSAIPAVANRQFCSKCFCFVCDVPPSGCSQWVLTGAPCEEMLSPTVAGFGLRVQLSTAKGNTPLACTPSGRPTPSALKKPLPG